MQQEKSQPPFPKLNFFSKKKYLNKENTTTASYNMKELPIFFMAY
jgi:hypothetical protein